MFGPFKVVEKWMFLIVDIIKAGGTNILIKFKLFIHFLFIVESFKQCYGGDLGYFPPRGKRRGLPPSGTFMERPPPPLSLENWEESGNLKYFPPLVKIEKISRQLSSLYLVLPSRIWNFIQLRVGGKIFP